MPGKHKNRRKPRPLNLKVHVVNLPEGTTKGEYLSALAEAVLTHELPDGYEVELSWKNPTTKKGRSREWQAGEFTEVLSDSAASSPGFAMAVSNAIAAQSEFPRDSRAYKAAVKSANIKAIVAAAPDAKTVAKKLAAKKGKAWTAKKSKPSTTGKSAPKKAPAKRGKKK